MNRSSTADAAVVSAVVPRGSARPRRALRYGLPALAAAALTTVGPGPVSAGGGGLPAPEENHVWAGCQLDSDTVEAIQDDVFTSSLDGSEFSPFGSPSNVQVAFIVVYSLQENDGQGLDGGEGPPFSGPILCAGGFPFGGGGIAPFNVATTTEDSPIPDPSTGADSVDILDLEEALILRYAPNFEGGGGGDPEKRFCHTVDENTDCFTVFGPFFD
jgi:hypothetical protein